MVKVIMGRKGSGKTKKLIEMVNSATSVTKGNVVCIEKGNVLTFNIDYKVRLVDISEYAVTTHSEMLAFISGLLAGNYDITDIFIDSIIKTCGSDLAALGDMIEKLAVLSDKVGLNITITVSADESEVPESIKKYA